MNSAPGENTSHIGRYRIVRTLKVAASNEIVLAIPEGPNGDEGPVAIKRLLPGFEHEESRARCLTREALAYARLSHPAVLRMHDFFEVDGLPVLVLELVDGLSLAELLDALRARAQRLPQKLAIHVAAQLFSALAAAHEARDLRTQLPTPVIHRDVNPGNVLLSRAGEVKLADFGVAHLGGGELETQSGITKGTWGYMAPEQVHDGAVTIRTDLYDGALVVRELLTGLPVFPRVGQTHLAYLQEMAAPGLAPMTSLGLRISRELLAALDRALEPNPSARHVSAAELHGLLAAHADAKEGAAALAALVAEVTSPRTARANLAPSVPPNAFDATPSVPPNAASAEVVREVEFLLAALEPTM